MDKHVVSNPSVLALQECDFDWMVQEFACSAQEKMQQAEPILLEKHGHTLRPRQEATRKKHHSANIVGTQRIMQSQNIQMVTNKQINVISETLPVFFLLPSLLFTYFLVMQCAVHTWCERGV